VALSTSGLKKLSTWSRRCILSDHESKAMALSSTFQKKILSNICPPKVERKMVLMPKANNSPTFGGKMHSVRSSQLCFLIRMDQTNFTILQFQKRRIKQGREAIFKYPWTCCDVIYADGCQLGLEIKPLNLYQLCCSAGASCQTLGEWNKTCCKLNSLFQKSLHNLCLFRSEPEYESVWREHFPDRHTSHL